MKKIINTVIRLNNGLLRRIRNTYYSYILKSCGLGLQVDKKVFITTPQNIAIGNNVVLNRGVVLQGTEGGCIRLGDNVTISYSAKIITANLNGPTGEHIYQDVVIGNNVWISANVIVLPGVVVEDNVVIAAGAVVTSRLISGYIYGGVPAKQIKQL